jgi:cytochrome c biogenesis protein CcmG, thiol:disulfide interchange protein DsbE
MTAQLRSWVVTLAVVGGLAGLLVLGYAQSDRYSPIEVGSRAPAYAAPSLAGDTVALQDLRGQVVVLNVWATWCPPCRWEMPSLERLQRELGHAGVTVVAVSVDAVAGERDGTGRPGGDVAAYVEEAGLSFTILLDPASRIQDSFGVRGLPTTFLIDRSGRIRKKVLGPAEWDQPPYIDDIRELLES